MSYFPGGRPDEALWPPFVPWGGGGGGGGGSMSWLPVEDQGGLGGPLQRVSWVILIAMTFVNAGNKETFCAGASYFQAAVWCAVSLESFRITVRLNE